MKNTDKALWQGPGYTSTQYSSSMRKRSWGTWRVVEEWPGVKVKEIVVNPHSALSYQKHEHRGEFWVVQSGSGTFVKEERHYPVKAGDTFLVLRWEWHQIVNGNNEPLVVIETQFGEHVVEDDIKRK